MVHIFYAILNGYCILSQAYPWDWTDPSVLIYYHKVKQNGKICTLFPAWMRKYSIKKNQIVL